AAIAPPKMSPAKSCQLYRPLRFLSPSLDPRAGGMFLGHHFRERGLELVHLLLRADRHANVSRPARPHTADIDLLLAQGLDDLAPRPLHVEHKLIRTRRHERVLALLEISEHVIANGLDDGAALGHQLRLLQAGVSSDHAGNR